MLYSKSRIEIFYKYELIGSHERVKGLGIYTTDPAHMASYHQHLTDWNPVRFMEEAHKIHSDVGSYIEQVILKKPHPEQAYKSCQGILSFAKRLGNERLIRACQRAHQCGVYQYRIIESILVRNLDQYDIEEDTHPMPKHDNIRGEDYYK